MRDLHFLILFGIICVMCPCEGQINSPPDGERLVFKKGTIAKIVWVIDETVNLSKVKFRLWNFIDDSRKTNFIGSISGNDDPVPITTILPGVEIIKPATLVLNNVHRRYNGTYEFQLAGEGISDRSTVVVVIAETPTVSVNCSGTTTLNEGDYFACRCEGEGGYPKPVNVTWYNTNQVQIDEAGEEEKILILSSVKKTESGSYKCEAKTSEVTKNETSIQLIVNYKPDIRSFTSRPAEPVVGQSVTIMCVANARPEPTTYSIIFNGTEVSDDNTYTISKVGQNDAGTYVCKATNALGNSLKSYTLVVGQSTTIPTSKGNETVAKDEESGSGSLGGGAIAGIVIGVLVVVVIVAGVIYWFKFKPNGKDHGSRKDTEEKAKKKRGDENVYDAVNMDDKASGSRSSHELESPMNYAVLDKNALNTGAPKKPDRDAEESTAYASIDVGKVGQVEADLV